MIDTSALLYNGLTETLIIIYLQVETLFVIAAQTLLFSHLPRVEKIMQWIRK